MTGGATNADELVADMFRQAFRFVTDGVRDAVERATAVAGDRASRSPAVPVSCSR